MYSVGCDRVSATNHENIACIEIILETTPPPRRLTYFPSRGSPPRSRLVCQGSVRVSAEGTAVRGATSARAGHDSRVWGEDAHAGKKLVRVFSDASLVRLESACDAGKYGNVVV